MKNLWEAVNACRPCVRPTLSYQVRRCLSLRAPRKVASVGRCSLDVDQFRTSAFKAEQPLVIRYHDLESLPAITRWFGRLSADAANGAPGLIGLSSYLDEFSMVHLPYELITSDGTSASFLSWLTDSRDAVHQTLAGLMSHHAPFLPAAEPQFLRFGAPLALLIAATKFNQTSPQALTRLYIAQAPLSELPTQLQADLPVPDLVTTAGKGDIYDSSIWMGLEPTYTAWHRDPNPNFFYQLCSSKIIRLLPPKPGEQIFREVQMRLGRAGSSKIRGEEMMYGAEKAALHDAIWASDTIAQSEIQEAHLEPGHALFIPKGWWHSVKSSFADGRLNGSVNWWFR